MRANPGGRAGSAGSGQPPAPSRRYGQFAFDDPFSSGRILDAKWTRTPGIGPHRAAKKPTNCRQSPLSDSNRRPLPYHGRSGVSRAYSDARERARNPCKQPQSGVCGRRRRNTADADLADAEWTRSRRPFAFRISRADAGRGRAAAAGRSTRPMLAEPGDIGTWNGGDIMSNHALWLEEWCPTCGAAPGGALPSGVLAKDQATDELHIARG